MITTEQMVKKTTVVDMAVGYRIGLEHMLKVIEHLVEMRKALRVFNDDKYYPMNPFDSERSCYHTGAIATEPKDIEQYRKQLIKDCWKAIIKQTNILASCTAGDAKKINDSIEQGTMPEITEENINAVLQDIIAKAPQLIENFIKDAYNHLRPHGSKLQTNKPPEIGKKAIVRSGYYSLDFTGYRREMWSSIDNAFRLLDGKGCGKPGDSLVWRLDNASKQGDSYEDEYFKMKFYKNCNVHIEFKRMDIVEQINRIGAGGRLKEGVAK